MNKKLKYLYDQDIADRYSNLPVVDQNKRDETRIQGVTDILKNGKSFCAQDYHHAALIFQHGDKLEHFQKAHELAMKAVQMGDSSAKWLAAASLDRSLLMAGKPQKYGTQFGYTEPDGWKIAEPIDPTVTDEERAEWNVPPLKDALKTYKEKYNLS